MREQDVGIVVGREQRLDRRAAALLGVAREDILVAVACHHQARLLQPRDLADEILVRGHQLPVAHPLGAIGEIEMGRPTRARSHDLAARLRLRRPVGLALNLLDAKSGKQPGEDLAERLSVGRCERRGLDLAVV